ncbi:hypothetical protein EJB05_47215 [Eragrostis curvula]|uniref:Uncharacterized protein n=1 Tax=Eragrostis curvula TaxID=38414 RepID=A0A5J9T744_9POAL|nr:hypothetical protein EJB05_47215 [Eragrostis curvula]
MNLILKNAIMSTFINKFVNTEHHSSPKQPTLAAKSKLPRSLHVVPNFDDLSCYERKGESKGKGCFTVHVILSKFI